MAAKKTLNNGKVCRIKSTSLFQGCVDLAMDARICAALGKGFCSCLHGEEKLWIPPKLIKVQFEEEESLEKKK